MPHCLMRLVKGSRKLATARVLLLWQNFVALSQYKMLTFMNRSYTVLWWPLLISTTAIKGLTQVSHIASGLPHHALYLSVVQDHQCYETEDVSYILNCLFQELTSSVEENEACSSTVWEGYLLKEGTCVTSMILM